MIVQRLAVQSACSPEVVSVVLRSINLINQGVSTATTLDGGQADAEQAQDGAHDDATKTSDGHVDSNTVDAADAASASTEYVLGMVGGSCVQNQALGCEGHASRKVLICNHGAWDLFQTCAENERCDSRLGAGQGLCLSVPTACMGKAAGDVCDGRAKKTCGIDLVSLSDSACQMNAHCDDSSGTAGCACDTGLLGPDCATNACNPNSCQHGGGAAQGVSCGCGTSGYTGAYCETDINECATTNLCTSADYHCVQTEPPGYTCQGQFADWPMPDALAGSKVAPSYDTGNAGIVVDKVTGLVWQRDLPATYTGCIGQDTSAQGQVGDACTWSDAKKYCEGLTLAAQSDWRLPTKIELESIIDETKSNPAIDTAAFVGAPGVFWTASPSVTPTVGASGVAWVVGVGSGRSQDDSTDVAHRARCVLRTSPLGAATPGDRYVVDTGANTVTDMRTGLVWQRVTKTGSFNWDDAKAQCTGGFRLPAHKELLTLVDPTRTSPSIDSVFRGETESQDTPLDGFWTASPHVGSSGNAWRVNVIDGSSDYVSTAVMYHVRCVR